MKPMSEFPQQDPEAVAYNEWLQQNAADQHVGQDVSQKDHAAEQVASQQARLERLRPIARLGMRVKTGLATGEEVAYYQVLKDFAEEQSAPAAPAPISPRPTPTRQAEAPKSAKKATPTPKRTPASQPAKPNKSASQPPKPLRPNTPTPAPLPTRTPSKATVAPRPAPGKETTSPPAESKRPELNVAAASKSLPAAYRLNPEHPAYNTPNEDAMLINEQHKLFGVFDGMGGGGGDPSAASKVAAQAFDTYFSHNRIAALFQSDTVLPSHKLAIMKLAFQEARQAVDLHGQGGDTTAAVVQFTTFKGKQYALIGNAGDSRILKYPAPNPSTNYDDQFKPDTAYELATDQSRGNVVFNGLGPRSSGSKDEYRFVEVTPGDRIMICSDGITGDWQEQFLSAMEIEQAFRQPTPEASAQAFIAASKKTDDKTIIVIDVK